MYGSMKRHEIQVLRKGGLSLSEIAEKARVSRSTVKRILRETPVEVAPPPASRIGRPSVVDSFASAVGEIFKADPSLPTVEVLRRSRLLGYRGGKSALYDLVAKLRPKPVEPVVRFEGVPGEFSQHDFGHVRVTYVDGRTEQIHFFASRLKWSRWAAVTIVPDEAVESVVRTLLDHLASWGGQPLSCVFDNPKTIVLRRDGARIEWNPTFGQVAIDMRFGVELCTPGRGNEKGAVENLVKWVKNSFFKVRRFHDPEDLKDQLAEWLVEGNTQRPSRATGVVPAERLEVERKRLRPLPIAPEDYALRIPVFVGPTGHVQYRGVRYSMPAGALGAPGTLFLYKDRVEILTGRFSAEHPRHPETPGVSWNPEHRAQMVAAVSGRRGKLYQKRQQLFELGPQVLEFITEIVHARRRVWSADVEQLYELLVHHGPARLISAISEAARRNLFGAEYVTRLIKETA